MTNTPFRSGNRTRGSSARRASSSTSSGDRPRGTDAPYRHEIALNPAQIGQSVVLVHVRRLLAEDVSLVATIDRSEHVDVQYRVIDGELQLRRRSPSCGMGSDWIWFPQRDRRNRVLRVGRCTAGSFSAPSMASERPVSRSSTRRSSRSSRGWRSSTSLGPSAEEVRRRLSGTSPPTSPWPTEQSRSTSRRRRQHPRLASISDKVVAWRSPFIPICSPRSPKTFISFDH